MIVKQSTSAIDYYEMQEWRNWQTRRLQVPVVARSCGFKSHLLHSFFTKISYIRANYFKAKSRDFLSNFRIPGILFTPSSQNHL